MMDYVTTMYLQPIGIVHSDFKEPTSDRLDLTKIFAEVEIDPGLTEALEGLEEFSHIIVLFWLHRAHYDEKQFKALPMGNPKVHPQGIFALRTTKRPNPIGVTTVRLLEKRGNILKVQGLDAIDGSVVVDIKPYIPGYDSAVKASVPDWVQLEKEQL